MFYYRADCLALERRHSGLRQVTKTDKMSIKKDVRKQYHTIVRMYILWSNDRFGLNDPLLVTFTRTMPFSFSHVFKTLLQNKVVYLPLKLLCSICLFFQKETNPEKYSHNITLSVCRHKSLQWISGYGVGYSSPQRCDKHHRRRTLALKSTDKFRIITNPTTSSRRTLLTSLPYLKPL